MLKLGGDGVRSLWLLALVLSIGFIHYSFAAPISDDDPESGCYYMFQHYNEGDRIMTNEPCLNCTCHDSMLMCFLKVCPFAKPIGQDCQIEKRPDQCCPIITCPELPVPIMSMNMTMPMAVTTHRPLSPVVTPSATVPLSETEGCVIDGLFYEDGAQVPSDPEQPCDLCYCIRNHTACVMQECVLHVEGCSPVLQPGICCPVRYECDANNITSVSTTPLPPGSYGCTLDGQSYNDGDFVPSKNPCDYCYCMHGDIVCAVQDCAHPLEPFDGCQQVPNTDPNQCCPTYECVSSGAITSPDGGLIGEVDATTTIGSGVDTANLSTGAPPGIVEHEDSLAIHEIVTSMPEDSISTTAGESHSEGSTNASTESSVQDVESAVEQTQSTGVEENEEADFAQPATIHPEESAKPDESVSVLTPVEESSQFSGSLVTEQPSEPQHPSQLNSAENEPSGTHLPAEIPAEVNVELTGDYLGATTDAMESSTQGAVESLEGLENPATIPENEPGSESAHGTTEGESLEPEVNPGTEGTIASGIEEDIGTEQPTLDVNADAAGQSGSEQGTGTQQPMSESSIEATTEKEPANDLQGQQHVSSNESMHVNGSEQELEAQKPVSESSNEAITEQVFEEQQHSVESVTETASLSGSEQAFEAQEPSSSTEAATETESSQVTESQKPEQESTSEVQFAGEYEQGSQEQHSSTDSASSEIHQPETEVSIESASDRPEPQSTITSGLEGTGNHQPESTPASLTEELELELDNIGQIASTSGASHQESTESPEFDQHTDAPISEPGTLNHGSGSNAGVLDPENNQGQPESIENGGETLGEIQTSIEQSTQGIEPGNASDFLSGTITDISENSENAAELGIIASMSPAETIESGSSITEIPTESNDAAPNKPDEGSTLSPIPEFTHPTEFEGSSSTHTDEDSEAKPGESIPTNSQESTIAPVGSSLPPETAASETAESEGSAVEWSTQSPSSVPGEGSCLLNGITYADGDNIPPPSPCQISCKCESSIVRCKVVECPETTGINLENCRPVFMPNKCCPAFECDEPKTDSPHIIVPAPEFEVSVEGSGVPSVEMEFEINSSAVPSTESIATGSASEEGSNNEDSQKNEERPAELIPSESLPTDTDASVDGSMSAEAEKPVNQFEQGVEGSGAEQSQEALSNAEGSGDQVVDSQTEVELNVGSTTSATDVPLSPSEHEQGSGDAGSLSSELPVPAEGAVTGSEGTQAEVDSAVSQETVTEFFVSVSQQEQSEGSGDEQSAQPSEQSTEGSGDGESESGGGVNVSEGPTSESEISVSKPEESIEGSGSESSQLSELETSFEESGNENSDSQTLTTSEAPPAEGGSSASHLQSGETFQQEKPSEVSNADGDSQSTTDSGNSQVSSIESAEKPEYPTDGIGDGESADLDLETSTVGTNIEGSHSQYPVDAEVSQNPLTEMNSFGDQSEQSTQNYGEEESQSPSSEEPIVETNAEVGVLQSEIDSSVLESSTIPSVPEVLQEQITPEVNGPGGENSQAGSESIENEVETSNPAEGSSQESFSTDNSLTNIDSESSSPLTEIEAESHPPESANVPDAESQTSQVNEKPTEFSTASPESGAAPEVQASVAPEDEQVYIPDQESESPSSATNPPSAAQEPVTPQGPEDGSELSSSSSSGGPNPPEVETQTANTLNFESLPDESSVPTDSNPATVDENAAFPNVSVPATESESEHLPEDQSSVTPPSEGSSVVPNTEEESELDGISPSACLFDGKVYVSAQQIPREDHCDFCFCFRGDIICLQQSCPPPIPGCVEEAISGFCCPRYECPVRQVTHNVSWQDPVKQVQAVLAGIPQGFDAALTVAHQDEDQITVEGCEIKGEFYQFGELVGPASGPCLECRCGRGGMMECNPRDCQPEPTLRKVMALAANRRRRHIDSEGLIWVSGVPRRR